MIEYRGEYYLTIALPNGKTGLTPSFGLVLSPDEMTRNKSLRSKKNIYTRYTLPSNKPRYSVKRYIQNFIYCDIINFEISFV